MSDNETNVPRLIKIATLLFGIFAGSLVYFVFEPQVDVAQRALEDDESMLRSDEVVFNAVPGLRLKREQLTKRYAGLFSENPEAVFLRELSTLAKLRRVTVVSASLSTDPTEPGHGIRTLFARTAMQLELHGEYRNLLSAISDLSRGAAVVDVGLPAIRRDGTALLATVPLEIGEPAHEGGQP
ncbi:MAG: hypothetical protein ACLPYS_17075 [Vulcanimicrobiaceae bacterium]